VPADAVEADGGGQLPDGEVAEQDSACRQPGELPDEGLRLLLQPEELDDADHGQHGHEDRDRAAAREAGAEGFEDLEGVEAAQKRRDDAGDGDDDEWVQADRKANDHQKYPDEYKHDYPFRRGSVCVGVARNARVT
jgi:hypothetical protein